MQEGCEISSLPVRRSLWLEKLKAYGFSPALQAGFLNPVRAQMAGQGVLVGISDGETKTPTPTQIIRALKIGQHLPIPVSLRETVELQSISPPTGIFPFLKSLFQGKLVPMHFIHVNPDRIQ